MNISVTKLALALVALLLPGFAMAQATTLAEKLANTGVVMSVEIGGCDGDRQILCPGLPGDGKKLLMCLMAYEDHLSNTCKLGIVEAAMTLELGTLAIEYSISSCEADADRFCANVTPGEGRIVACLRSNEAKLQSQCVSALKETGLWNLGVE